MFLKISRMTRLCMVPAMIVVGPAFAIRKGGYDDDLSLSVSASAHTQGEKETVHHVQHETNWHEKNGSSTMVQHVREASWHEQKQAQKRTHGTRKHGTKTQDACSDAVEGAIARSTGSTGLANWFRSHTCKCPEKTHIECPKEGAQPESIRTFRPADLHGLGCTCEDGEPVQFKGDLSQSKSTCGSNFECNNIQVPAYGYRCCCVNLGGTVRPIDLVGSAKNTHEAFCHGYHNNKGFRSFDWTQHCGVLCRSPTQRELNAFNAATKSFDKAYMDMFWKGMAGVGGLSVSDAARVTPYLPAHAAGRSEHTFWNEMSDIWNGKAM